MSESTEPIDITVPLSSIIFGGELHTEGTNGPGDLVHVRGHVGPLYIETDVDSNLVYDDENRLPDTVEVRVRLSL